MEQHGGLLHALPSRRDYFAAAALQGLLSGRGIVELDNRINIDVSPGGIAALAVLAADALLDELETVSPAPAGSSAPPPRAEPPESGDVAAYCDCGARPGMAHLSACRIMVSRHRAPTRAELRADLERAVPGAEELSAKLREQDAVAGSSTAPSPVFVCEASFPGDADCPGAVTLDAKSKGWFCALHAGVEVVVRMEMHRLHGHRNRTAKEAEGQ